MPRFDGTSRAAADRDDARNPLPPVSLVEERLPYPQANLARGIVWADILADIAADEEARRLRDAA
ncbi:hypothetical protein [Actinophytocola sp. KF-1]